MIPLFTLIVKNILFLNCAKGLLFNIFKVFDGIGFKLVGGLVVTDDNAMLVHLEDADGPHMIDAALNGMVQRTGFLLPVTKIITSSASIMVPIPTVKTVVGTLLMSLSKSGN